MTPDTGPHETPAAERGGTGTAPTDEAIGMPASGAAEQETRAEVVRYEVALSRQARRNLHEDLPIEVAIAATETIANAIAVNPYRVGKPLNEPLDGYYSARRGTYRIIYRIDEAKRVVEIHSVRHRRDAYRT